MSQPSVKTAEVTPPQGGTGIVQPWNHCDPAPLAKALTWAKNIAAHNSRGKEEIANLKVFIEVIERLAEIAK
jgi:hypothetical protein